MAMSSIGKDGCGGDLNRFCSDATSRETWNKARLSFNNRARPKMLCSQRVGRSLAANFGESMSS